jgi:SOS-response transcriptional repressor LexA
MPLQTKGLLEQLDNLAPDASNLKSQLVSALGNAVAMQGFLNRECENRGEINCFPCKNEGVCLLFQGVTHLGLGRFEAALADFENANWHFRSRGETWNSVIGQILIAKTYEKNEDVHQAFVEYKTAYEFLVEHRNRLMSSYANSDRVRALEHELNAHIQKLAIRLSKVKQAQIDPPKQMPDGNAVGRVTAFLSLYTISLYGSVTAGPNGELYLDPYENTSTLVEQVELDGRLLDLFNVNGTAPRDRQISIIPQHAYGWLKVRGLSMNDWPLPFDVEDYVLFQKSQMADDQDYVIVAARDLAGDESLIVKRFDKLNGQFLSRSTDTSRMYPPIQADEDHKIVGVVLAVAKPSHDATLEQVTLAPDPNATPESPSTETQRLYNKLLTRALGDKEKIKRLIAEALKKAPHESHLGLLKIVDEDWIADGNRG